MTPATISTDPGDYLDQADLAEARQLCTTMIKDIRKALANRSHTGHVGSVTATHINRVRTQTTAAARMTIAPDITVDTLYWQWNLIANLATEESCTPGPQIARLQDLATAMHNRRNRALQTAKAAEAWEPAP